MVENVELDGEKRIILQKFKEIFKTELDEERRNDDIFLLRWLIARDFDIEKAKLMLSQALKWRKENNIENLRHESFPDLYRILYPYAFHGKDRDGRAILLFPWGRWNCRAACEAGEKEQLVRYMDQIFERGMSLSKKHHWISDPSKSHSQLVVLTDMQGLSYWQLAHKRTLEALLDLVYHYEGYYPESMYKSIIINAPWAFTVLFSMFKSLMCSKTIEKVSLYGADRSEWCSQILELVDPTQLPMSFGGTQHELF